jgi:hypothetical protein
MTGCVVMDAHGLAAHLTDAIRANLTLSRRPAGTAPTEPRPLASFLDDLSPPGPRRSDGRETTRTRASLPARKRVEVAGP